ncbi:MAG: OmpA family protein [Elusimicrobiota bacterium]|nr:OmpA family protein [Elusimicrobiota bacterium]
MKKLNLLLITATILLFLTITSNAKEKYNWAQKIIMPIENTSVYHNETFNFGRYKFAHSKVKDKKIKSITTVEGKKSSILYKAKGKGLFEIFSVYKRMLKNKGFEIVFTCEKDNYCGENFHKILYDLNPFESDTNWGYSSAIKGSRSANYYIAAKKKTAAGETYVSIFTNSGWWKYPVYRVDVAQISSLDTKLIPASDIEKAIKAEGRIAFYGINFDTGKSAIKNAAKPVLAEIATFLKKASGSFYVVGHTDNQGSLSNNMQLSKERSNSIVKFLIKTHGIAANKLSAHGVGPLSPVASNMNEEGRILNRRVEIAQSLHKASAQKPAVHHRPAPHKPERKVKVPSFKGTRVSMTKILLSRLGLKATIKQESAPVTVTELENIPDFEIKIEASLAAEANKSRSAGNSIAIVKAQSPAPGTEVKKGSVITLTTVSVKPNPRPSKPKREEENLVPVPKVTGKLFFSGYKILLKQGFKIKRKGKKIGFIRKQSPAPNTRVKKGSTITITIGR